MKVLQIMQCSKIDENTFVGVQCIISLRVWFTEITLWIRQSAQQHCCQRLQRLFCYMVLSFIMSIVNCVSGLLPMCRCVLYIVTAVSRVASFVVIYMLRYLHCRCRCKH